MKVLPVTILAILALLAFAACGERSSPATPTPPGTASGIPAGTATAGPTGPASPAASATPTASPTGDATSTPVPPAATARPATNTPAPPAPTHPPSATGTLISHGNRSSNLVALTFDMGGRVDPALDIMNYLVANRIPATVFMTGAMVDNKWTDAGRQVLDVVAAHPELFDLGNHSYSHPSFTDISPAEMRDELARTEASIAKYISTSPRPYFRPPNGAYNTAVVNTVAAAGYPYTIYWDVDTIDWKAEADGGPAASDIVAKVSAKAQGGSIVLMHLGGYNTYEALPRILAALRAKGLEPASLPAVME